MRLAAIGLLCAAVFGGCSLGADDEDAGRDTGAESQAAALVVRLDGLLRAGRYQEVCDTLLTARARAAAGGARCARGMRVRTPGLSEPRLELQSVSGTGRAVRAVVSASSAGHAPVERTVVMERVGRSLRVAGLSR